MGFMDKLKGAVSAVTGGAAKVMIEYQPQVALAGEQLLVKITATSTGAEVKSKGLFVDLRGRETVSVNKGEAKAEHDIYVARNTFEQSFQIAPAFVLPPNETKLFEGSLQIPPSVQPSFKGAYTEHSWQIQGRVEALGNDPDSGWQTLRIANKS